MGMMQLSGAVRIPLGALIAKVAVRLFAAVIETVQTPVPVQAPLQPVKVEPALGVAVSVTLVLYANEDEQDEVQLMPVGLDVTVPEPVPFMVRLSA